MAAYATAQSKLSARLPQIPLNTRRRRSVALEPVPETAEPAGVAELAFVTQLVDRLADRVAASIAERLSAETREGDE
jgi:hypothetical protein